LIRPFHLVTAHFHHNYQISQAPVRNAGDIPMTINGNGIKSRNRTAYRKRLFLLFKQESRWSHGKIVTGIDRNHNKVPRKHEYTADEKMKVTDQFSELR
jgi:hypothetical protein